MFGVYIEKWMFKTEREVLGGLNKKVSTDSSQRWDSLIGMSRDAQNNLLTTQRLEKMGRATAIKVYLREAYYPYRDQYR